MQKNLEVENKKSELEAQYEKLFNPTIPKMKAQRTIFRRPIYHEEFVTWVTYGAYEDPIV